MPLQLIRQTAPLILGSGSPRRAQLLLDMGLEFTVQTKPTDENWPSEMAVQDVAAYLAKKKALAFDHEANQNVILTADTTVCVENLILNKATNFDEAMAMLHELNGKTHQVVTGFCLRYQDRLITQSAIADVTFAKLDFKLLEHYVRQFLPFDKAGAYGIQEWIGLVGIETIQGSFYTVMGLPTHAVYRELGALYASIPA